MTSQRKIALFFNETMGTLDRGKGKEREEEEEKKTYKDAGGQVERGGQS